MGVNLEKALLVALLAAVGFGITGDSRIPPKNETEISRTLEDKLKSALSTGHTVLSFPNILVDQYHPIGAYSIIRDDKQDTLSVYSEQGSLVFRVEHSSHYFKKIHGKSGYIATTLDEHGRVERKIYFHADSGEQYRIFSESVDVTETFSYEKDGKKNRTVKHTEYNPASQSGRTMNFSEIPENVAEYAGFQFKRQYGLNLSEIDLSKLNVHEIKHSEVSTSKDGVNFKISSGETTYILSTPLNQKTNEQPRILELHASLEDGNHKVTSVKFYPNYP